jgi:cation diffusion facilitator family transporter
VHTDHDHDHGSAGHEHAAVTDHGHGTGAGHEHGAEPGHEHGAWAPHKHGAWTGPGHAADHDHGHGQLTGLWRRLTHLVTPHSHDSAERVDAALSTSAEGMRALWRSLSILGVAALLQGLVVLWSGSVGLLGDTLHNLADALTAVPLGIAFVLGRRPPNRRYTYGYGRAEDLAGVAIVVVIAASAVAAAVAAIERLLHPQRIDHLLAVAIAAVVGFLANEWVALYRIRVGRRIGSAALVADGLHARADGYTSLAVLVGAGGVALGLRWADPVIGLLITAAILFVLRDAAREVYRRLMDAVDPATVDAVEATLRATPGVLDVSALHIRWLGHQLRAECAIVVDTQLSVLEAHKIAVDAEHRLIHEVPRLRAALVHADPAPHAGEDHHEALADHR